MHVSPDFGAAVVPQEMVATDALLHYVDCGPPFIKHTRTGYVLDGVRISIFITQPNGRDRKR